MMLRVPPASLKNLEEYIEAQNKRRIPLSLVVTKITFDKDQQGQVLLFAHDKFLNPVDAARVVAWRDDPHVERMLQISLADREVTGDVPPDTDEIASEELEAAGIKTTVEKPDISDAAAKAKAILKAREAATAAAAAKPNGATAPEPTKLRTAPTPGTKQTVAKPATPTAAEIAAKEKADKLAAIRAAAAAALEAAEKAAQELADAEGDEVTIDGAAEEVAEEVAVEEEVSSSDILDALDQELAGIPD
jgi:hypothetical protein